MRKILSWLGGAIGAVVVIVLLAPFVLPATTVQRFVEAEVERATGRRLAIGDEFSISVFPRIEARARAVRLASAPDMSIPNLLDIDELRLGLELWPLLSRRVVVTELAMIRPVFALEITDDGRQSWDFSATRPAAPGASPARGRRVSPPASLFPTSRSTTAASSSLIGAPARCIRRARSISSSPRRRSTDRPRRGAARSGTTGRSTSGSRSASSVR
ncbi:MAG: AsmA family protein [Alphaproteobacteria bacterium]|nr:AsmA family protein [Alphaproteobacteria bacterium]